MASDLPADRYDPDKVLNHPDYRVLARDDPILNDKDVNLACSYNADKVMRMLRKPMPEIEPDEVLLHVRATGICGSDVHFWKEGRIGNNVLCQECGAGHESAGEVIEVGSEVTQWKIGDRVAMEAGIPCGRADCSACLSGSYKSCPKMVFFSSPPYHGTMTRFHAHPAAWLHRLPDNVSYGEGALVEPLAVGLEAVDIANVRLGDPVLICGAGPIGLVTLLCADAAGCCPIVITDLVQSRLDLAKKLVPTVNTLQIQRDWEPEQCAERIRQAADTPIKTALDCTGFESSVATAIHSLAFGGKVIVVGIGPAKQSYPFMTCAMNEIGIQFIFRYKHQYPKALRLIQHGKLNLKPLITHEVPLSQAPKAFDIAGDPSQGSVKVQVVDYD